MLIYKTGLMVLAALTLAACDGSGSDFTSMEQASRTFAQDDGDLATALGNGATLSSRAGTSTGIELNFGGGTTNLTSTDVAISLNDAGELTATLNGESRVFTAADRQVESDGSVYGYEFRAENGMTFSLYNHSGPLEDLLTAGNGYGTVVTVGADLTEGDDTLYTRSYTALGAETTDAALNAMSGSATYKGSGRLDLYTADNFEDSGTSRSQLRGDVTLTADFDDGQISGAMENLTLRAPGSDDRLAFGGQVDFGAATFDQNTFSGAISGDQALADAGLTLNDDGTYNGAFFGPNAEEVHGVMSASGALNGTEVNGVGYFTN